MNAPWTPEEREAVRLAKAHADLALLGRKVERIAMPLLLTLAATMGTVAIIAQIVKWVAR